MRKTIKIGNRIIGEGHPSYIIFEVASTHSNNWSIAKAYVKQAKAAGADALKFQLFTADKLLNPIAEALKPTYNYFKSAETPRSWFPKLIKLCQEAGLDFLCTPFDKESATFLDLLNIPAFKIASGDLTNHQLLVHIAKFRKPVILSTGMATMSEIIKAIQVLENSGCKNYAILQCTSIYPMPYEDANLKVLKLFKDKFQTVIGYSDNGSKGDFIPRLAVALGASIIEKHVTSQKQRGNMDDIFSLSVEEFTQMAKKIREMEKKYRDDLSKALIDLKQEFGEDVTKALGNGQKRPASFGTIRTDGVKRKMTENDERHWARRGLYLIKDFPKGTIINEKMVISLRPDVGISSLKYDRLIGAKATEDLKANMPLFLEGNSVRQFRKSDIKKFYQNEDSQFVKILLKTALFK